MKMSDVFNEDVNVCGVYLIVEPEHTGGNPEEKNDTDGTECATYEQEQAINLAVNNHDALVDVLTNWINSSVNGEVANTIEAIVNGAILLDKIKGES